MGEVRRVQREEKRERVRYAGQGGGSGTAALEIEKGSVNADAPLARFTLENDSHPSYRRSLIPERLRVTPVPSEESLRRRISTRSTLQLGNPTTDPQAIESDLAP